MLAEFPSQNNLAVSHSCRTRLVTLQSLFTNASWILWRVSAPLEPSSSFIDSIDIRFKGFFLTSFPKIIFVIFYSFVVYEPVERNFYIPCMSRTQARKKIPFYRLQSFFTWLFLYEKEVKERVFSSTLHFAWQFSCKWNWWRVIITLLFEFVVQLLYHKLKYANLIERNSIYTGAIHLTKNFQKFRSKLNGSVQSNQKSFKKNWSTFWGGPLFLVRPVRILVEWIALCYHTVRSWSLWLYFFKCCFLLEAAKEKYIYSFACD